MTPYCAWLQQISASFSAFSLPQRSAGATPWAPSLVRPRGNPFRLGSLRAPFCYALLACLGPIGASAAPTKPTTAILVDKKTNQLHLVDYLDGQYRKLKTFHVTLGQVKGDKEDQDDLKTPEGIYVSSQFLTPPTLKPKFGAMAFYLNYPNAFDQIAGRTGFDIMLHATDEPERLKQNYDSKGCVVLRNEEIREIQPFIRLGLTPVLIFAELDESNSEWMSPGRVDSPVRKFFEGWIQAWETKDVEAYIDYYHSEFTAQGMSREDWRTFKRGLTKRYATIQVGAESVHYYRHPKYSVVTFTQNYRSTLVGSGSVGHQSRGTKILYIAEQAGKPKIVAETFTNRMW